MKKIIVPSDGWWKEASQAVEKEVRARYAERLKEANWWRRLVLELIILRETDREMKRRFPPTSLYLQPSPLGAGRLTPEGRSAWK